jgi:hypothetical protein
MKFSNVRPSSFSWRERMMHGWPRGLGRKQLSCTRLIRLLLRKVPQRFSQIMQIEVVPTSYDPGRNFLGK